MAAKLDKLHELIESMSNKLSGEIQKVNEGLTNLTQKVDAIESSVDDKIEGLKEKFEAEIKALKKDVIKEAREESETVVKAHADPIKADMEDLREKLKEYDSQLERLTSLLCIPFHPDRSIVIYGLKTDEGEDDETAVTKLFTDLELDVELENVERTAPRGKNQLGVVKVELSCLEDKISVLRAKRKCEDLDRDAKVTIRTCESHIERVARINNKFLLQHLGINEEFIITGHGIIKPKEYKDDVVKQGGDENDDDETPDDDDNNSALAEVSDKGGPRDDSDQNKTDKNRKKTNESKNNPQKKNDQSTPAAKKPDGKDNKKPSADESEKRRTRPKGDGKKK